MKDFISFDWDETKRLSNIEKHGIDFPRAARALSQSHLESRSDQNGECRILAICPDTDDLIAIVYTMRGESAGSYQQERQGKMSEERIVRYSLDEIREKIARGEDRTDLTRVAAMTDEDIDRAMRDDPDWAGFENIDWSKAEVVFPTAKQSISIRLDQDVVDFFKSTGKGYQTRMNAVLRHYVHEQKKRPG
ncbi:BrnA antitoxin family protein [Rhizobium rhizogenes]|uniref:BrnA antitoxin family protein n=2 Tax=Rhizobiaceae TaxID=82115 RepID=UPI00387094BD